MFQNQVIEKDIHQPVYDKYLWQEDLTLNKKIFIGRLYDKAHEESHLMAAINTISLNISIHQQKVLKRPV